MTKSATRAARAWSRKSRAWRWRGRPIGWVAAAADATEALPQPGAFAHVRIPVLIATAGEEQLVDNASHDAVAAQLPDATHITIAGAKHEILMERDELRAQFWAAFDQLAERVAPVPALKGGRTWPENWFSSPAARASSARTASCSCCKRAIRCAPRCARCRAKPTCAPCCAKAASMPGDRLTFAAADLTSDAGWPEAVAGCAYVLHVASPFPPAIAEARRRADHSGARRRAARAARGARCGRQARGADVVLRGDRLRAKAAADAAVQ